MSGMIGTQARRQQMIWFFAGMVFMLLWNVACLAWIEREKDKARDDSDG